VQCENDFKRFNPNVSEAASGKGGDADELLNYHITVDDLIRVSNLDSDVFVRVWARSVELTKFAVANALRARCTASWELC